MTTCPSCGSTSNDEKAVFCDDCGEQMNLNNSAIATGDDPALPAADEADGTDADQNTGTSTDSPDEDEDELIPADTGDGNGDSDAADAADDLGPVIQTLYLPGGKEVEIREGDVHILSRTDGGHPNASIKIDDSSISSAGVKIEGRDGKVFVTDLGSGLVTVGNVIPIEEETEVRGNGIIVVGESYVIVG